MLTNAYDMVELLRSNIGEVSPANWTKANTLRMLNQAYTELIRRFSMSAGQWLVKSKSITCTDSVITFPDDCMKPVYLEDSDNSPVNWLNSVGQRRISRTFGTGTDINRSREAYVLRNSIEINEDSLNETMTLWYQQKPYELHAGTASASTAGTLTLEDSLAHSVRNDHYNKAELEVIGGSNPGVYDVTDYVGSTRVLTLTPAVDPGSNTYGIVPITPSECNDYIVLRATVLAMSKPGANMDEKVFAMFTSDFKAVRNDLTAWIDTRVIENQGMSIGEPYL
ncbi:MAG: hypothetical protein DRN30_00920 [Thermoplasmata archaeon]|nr:MAG: hypothetical protein DRN30_00920 [Thermoplasmata archaeon]